MLIGEAVRQTTSNSRFSNAGLTTQEQDLSFAVDVFTVSPRFGRLPDPELLRADLRQALAGRLPLADRLAVLEQRYRSTQTRLPPPRVLWFDGAATDATVVELRAGRPVLRLYNSTAHLAAIASGPARSEAEAEARRRSGAL